MSPSRDPRTRPVNDRKDLRTMVKRIVIASAAALALLMIGAPARAHHSANAEFDTQKEFTITGTLTKLENVNPHSWWYVDVKGPDGKVQSWKLESLSPVSYTHLTLPTSDL